MNHILNWYIKYFLSGWVMINITFLCIVYSFFFFERFLQRVVINFFRRNTTNKTIEPIEMMVKRITSRRRYWYQWSFWPPTRKCSAPPCLTTYSTQNTIVSRWVMGLSCIIFDLDFAFFVYLKISITWIMIAILKRWKSMCIEWK